MSRRLKPLAQRKGHHHRSRWQRRRIDVLFCHLACMNACASLYVNRGYAPTMMVQHILADIVPSFKRVRTELEGLRGLPITHMVGPKLIEVLSNPPKF